jgi:hypothetical protein
MKDKEKILETAAGVAQGAGPLFKPLVPQKKKKKKKKILPFIYINIPMIQ